MRKLIFLPKLPSSLLTVLNRKLSDRHEGSSPSFDSDGWASFVLAMTVCCSGVCEPFEGSLANLGDSRGFPQVVVF